jgi:hypothetical protein
LIVTLGNLKLGERYIVRAFGKGRKPRGGVDFCSGYPSYTMEFDEGSQDEWRAGYAYVVVPKKVKTMRVLLGGAEGDTVWYDDIGIYPDCVK